MRTFSKYHAVVRAASLEVRRIFARQRASSANCPKPRGIERLDHRILLSSVTATPVSSSEIDLAITPDSGAVTMEVDRSTDGVNYAPIYSGVAATAVNDTGLSPDTTCQYQMIDYDGYGNPFSPSSTSATTGPSAPTVSAAANGPNEIDLTIGPDSSATSMQVFRDGAQIYDGVVSGTFDDTGLSPDQCCSYTVVTSNSSGSASGSTSGTSGLAAPAITAAGNGPSEIDLTLSYDSNATAMQIFRDGTQIYTGVLLGAYDDNSLSADQSCSYTVTTSNANGSSSASASGTSGPSNPTVSAAPNGASEIDLTIGADSNATSMQILRDGTQIYSGVTLAGYNDDGLSADQSCSYSVITSNASGSSSGSASATTGPSAPAVSAAANGGDEIDLTIGPDSTTTSMQILRDGTQIYSGTPVTGYTDASLSPDSTYSYTVITANSNGSSSGSASATTGDSDGGDDGGDTSAPSAPTVTATTANSGEIDLTISSDSSATSMEIDRDGTQIYSGGVISSLADTGLSADTSYGYSVVTSNANGSSSGSASATTDPLVITAAASTVTNGIGTSQTLEVDVAGVMAATQDITPSGYDSTISVSENSLSLTGSGETAFFTIAGNSVGSTTITFSVVGTAAPVAVAAPVLPDTLSVQSLLQVCTWATSATFTVTVQDGLGNVPAAPRSLAAEFTTAIDQVRVSIGDTVNGVATGTISIGGAADRSALEDAEASGITIDDSAGGATTTMAVEFVAPNLTLSAASSSLAFNAVGTATVVATVTDPTNGAALSGVPVSATVLSNGGALSLPNSTFGGETDNNGQLTFTLTTNGTGAANTSITLQIGVSGSADATASYTINLTG